MNVDTEIDDANLDDLHPDEDDGDPMLFVHVSVRVPDGMGFNGSVAVPAEDVTPAVVAEALVSALHGAAMTYSPATWTALNKWLREPKGLQIVKGGEDA